MQKENNDSAEQYLQKVVEVCKQAETQYATPDYKLAQQMLRLMNGETSVLNELTSLKPALVCTAVLNADADGEGQESLISGTSETSVRESKGLLGLTKENIVDIKTYVRTSLSLKTTADEVAKEVGYTDDSYFSKDHPEFSPTKFAEFYKPFHEHAEKWNSLETNIIQQGNDIQTYSVNFVSHAGFILEQIEKMPIYTTVEEAEMTDTDKKTITALSSILDRWKEETNTYKSKTDALLKELGSFQDKLSNELSPSASDMSKKLNVLDIEGETAALKKEMDLLQEEIDAKQKEYNKYCGLACTGAAGIIGGPLVLVTWSVTGGVYGAKAEKARKERNRLQSQLKEKQELYNNLNQVAASVHKATSGIENLGIAVTNGITGVRTLNAVWSLMSGYITSAKDSLSSVDSKSTLMEFSFELEAAKSSWNDVPSIAAGLLNLFKEADASVKVKNSFRRAMVLLDNAEETGADKDTWNDKLASLNKVIINTDSKYMPALQQKAQELCNYAVEIYDSVQKDLPSAVFVKGKQAKLASDPEKLKQLEEDIKNDPSNGQAADLFNKIINNLNKRADEFEKALKDIVKNINDNAGILRKNVRTDLSSTGFYAQLNNECKRFETVIQTHTKMIINNFIQPMKQLEEEMKELDADIGKKTDPENIISKFKEFLPSSSEVSDMLSSGSGSAEAAEIQALEIFYKAALNGIDVMASVIKLCGQIEKRSQLASELEELQEKFNKVYKNHKELLRDQDELNELLKLSPLLNFFAEQGQGQAKQADNVISQLAGCLGSNPVDYAGYNGKISEYIEKVSG